MFVISLNDKHVGYANCTTLDLLTHLYDTYGKISDADLRKNYKIMTEPYGVNLPIENFLKRVEDCVDFAAVGKTPYTYEQVVFSAFCTIKKTGVMADDAKEWIRKPSPQKTWSNFKFHFSRAHHELRESMKTTELAGFSANVVQEEMAQAINFFGKRNHG